MKKENRDQFYRRTCSVELPFYYTLIIKWNNNKSTFSDHASMQHATEELSKVMNAIIAGNSLNGYMISAEIQKNEGELPVHNPHGIR